MNRNWGAADPYYMDLRVFVHKLREYLRQMFKDRPCLSL